MQGLVTDPTLLPAGLVVPPLDSGLSSAQVEQSRAEHGSNALPDSKSEPWWRQYLAGYQEPTILLLMGAALIATTLSLLTGKPPLDGIAIIIAVFIATTVNFVNEFRAEQDFERLKSEFERILTTVVRDGKVERITADQVVVGDIIRIETGTLIPADGVILQSVELMIDTAPIDGESMPKEKGGDSTGEAEQHVLLRGHRVTQGTALMVITAVGTGTAMWTEVVNRLEEGRNNDLTERTPLQERLDHLASLIARVGIFAALGVLLALLARTGLILAGGHDITLHGTPIALGFNGETLLLLVEYLLVAVTIVVVAVPEGLPFAVTISLALSARAIARDNNLVRKPKATETIGQTNVICTDKTGTLTENRMTVQQVYTYHQRFEVAQIAAFKDHPALPMIALTAALDSTASIEPREGRMEYIGNPTESALLAWLDVNGEDYRRWRQTATLEKQSAFSSTRKTMETIVSYEGKRYRLIKGAPEIVIAQCRLIETAEGPALIEGFHATLHAELEAMSGQAMRTLALAYEPLTDALNNPMPELRLLALFGLADPVREGVAEAIQQCRDAGISVKMITGDNIATATAISRQLKLIDSPDQVVLASDWRVMPVEQRRKTAMNLRVLARAVPSDKEELVGLLQQARLVVTVTGDGVNDAPALQKADVGVAMGIRGTDIAKQASDIVLLDDNFRSIVRAVHWGRALFENIQSFIQFQLTINLSALAIVFFATILGLTPEPGEPPLTVIQLLWVNLIMDTLAVLALCLEPPVPEQMTRKPKGRTEPFITRQMWTSIFTMALFFTVVILGLLAFLQRDGAFSLRDSTVVFAVYVFFQVFNEVNARSIDPSRSPFKGILRNRSFLLILALIIVIQVVITEIGGTVGEFVFRTEPLPVEVWLLILAGTSTALIFGETMRRIRRAVAVQRKPVLTSPPSPLSVYRDGESERQA